MSQRPSSGSERPQPQLHVMREPNGFRSDVASLLARPDGGREVAEVVSDLEGNCDISILFLLRDHSDEEADLVGLPKGDDTVGGAERDKLKMELLRLSLGVYSLGIILEVLRFSQLVVLGRSVFPCQNQLFTG